MGASGSTPGERWAAEALTELRKAGFHPRAWIAFLSASARRAAETRGQRPELARQAARWSAAWAVASLAARAVPGAPRAPASAEAAWWAANAAMLRWHLGMVEGPAGERRTRLSAADAFTLGRLWLVPRVGAASGRPKAFTGLVVVAAASDAADGRLAARAGPTRLGRDLDTAADLCLHGTATVAAARSKWLPRGLAAALVARQVAEVGWVTAHYLARGEPPPPGPRALSLATSPVLSGGLVAAATGRRRTAAVSLGGASAVKVAVRLAGVHGPRGVRDAAAHAERPRDGV